MQLEEDSEDDSGSETEREGGPRVTIARTKGESADEKKARKAAVKAERSVGREQKDALDMLMFSKRRVELRKSRIKRRSLLKESDSSRVTTRWLEMDVQRMCQPGVKVFTL